MSFLRKVAYSIYEDHKNELCDIIVVLPSQRSGIFFLNYLAECTSSATIAPEVLTMDQWMTRIARQEPTDYFTLLLAFLEVARLLVPERCNTLSEFMAWGPIVLSDFNSLDEQLIDPKSILSNTARAKILEQWQPETNRQKGELEKKFEKFYESLPKLYEAFTHHLISKKYITKGLLYRKAADLVTKESLPGRKVYFAGFNALTRAEYEMISKLVTSGKAEFIGDYDAYYCTHFPYHEAGTFYRKWKDKGILSAKTSFTNDLLTQQKSITHHRIAGRVHQTQVLASLIQKLKEDGKTDFRRVAVVLPDENMLFPLLQQLPEVSEGINVTMQLPLEKLQVYQWIISFIKLLENASRDTSPGRFHHRQLTEVVSNALANTFFEADRIKNLLREIAENNLIYIDHSMVNHFLFDGKSTLFAPVHTPLQLLGSALALVDLSIEKAPDSDILTSEQLYMMRELLTNLKGVTAEWPEDFLKLQDLVHFIEATAKKYGISLRGEPVQGLQIMGMLETRLLDFDTVFILSANDGILPKTIEYQSIIPYDIAVAHGLPEHRHQLAVYSYHFYQLLKNAKEIHLLSYTSATGTEQSIPSRYIYQLEWELASENPKITFTYQPYILSLKSTHYSIDFQLKKDISFVRDLSERLTSGGISPTHLANYIERPKDFYLRYLLGIRDEEEVMEQADDRIKGNIVHKTLKRLYEPYLNSFPDAKTLKASEALADRILEEELHAELPNADWNTGRNYLEKFLTKQMIVNQLQIDLNRLYSRHYDFENPQIIYLEESFETILNVPDLGEVKLYGTVDRLEKDIRNYHIIDYKTGSVPSNKHFDLSNIDFSDKKKRIKAGKPLQLICYMLMVADSFGNENTTYTASLHFLRHKKDNEKFLFKMKSNNQFSFGHADSFRFSKEELETYRAIIIDLILEMLDIHTIENQILGVQNDF